MAFLSSTLNTALFPTSHNTADHDYTHLYLSVLNYDQPGNCIQTEVCLHTVCYSLKESVQKNHFHYKKIPLSLSHSKEKCGYVIGLPEFLELHLLLHAAYSP
jgi:hypothetical protein